MCLVPHTMVDLASLLTNPYVQFVLILVGGLIAATVLHLIIRIVFGHLAAKTETDLDDLILKIIIGPLYIFMVFVAGNIAVKTVETVIQDLMWIDSVFFVIYVLIITYVVAKILSLIVNRWLQVQKQYEKAPKILGKIVAVIIWIIAFLIVLQHFNVEISPLIATLGVGGLAVGLALQGTLSNLFAGLHILSDKPVKVGDFVEVDGTKIAGHVEDIGWRSTRIKTLSETIIIVPNAKLADSIIINDSLPESPTELAIKCGVSYNSDLDFVEKVTIDAVTEVQKTHEFGVKDFVPSVRYNAFADSNIEFNVLYKVTRFDKKGQLTTAVVKAIKRAYDKNRIEISYPVRIVHQK